MERISETNLGNLIHETSRQADFYSNYANLLDTDIFQFPDGMELLTANPEVGSMKSAQ